MKGVSVIICCYNSSKKIDATLNHLAKQQTSGLSYQLIIVDNNCTDNTIDTAIKTWALLGTPYPFKIVKQPKAGLNNARQLGINTAIFDYVVLCDDDNWLCSDYLLKVFYLFESMPDTALIGGVGEAVTDEPLPLWFTEINGFGYAVGLEGRKTGYVNSVYGAGMALKRTLFLKMFNSETSFILTDRNRNILTSGGDMEICILIKKAGYNIYLDESLLFKHFLSSNRLQWPYYLKLRRSFGKASAYLQLNEVSIKLSRAKELVSLIKFAMRHLKYLLFAFYFKNKKCAVFTQQMSLRLTTFMERKKIEHVARQNKLISIGQHDLHYIPKV